MTEPIADRAAICEHAGHEWADAGGDLSVCLVCEAESWASEGTAAYWARYRREETT